MTLKRAFPWVTHWWKMPTSRGPDSTYQSLLHAKVCSASIKKQPSHKSPQSLSHKRICFCKMENHGRDSLPLFCIYSCDSLPFFWCAVPGYSVLTIIPTVTMSRLKIALEIARCLTFPLATWLRVAGKVVPPSKLCCGWRERKKDQQVY